MVQKLPSGLTNDDWVAAEEPLELRVNGRSIAVVMRTPGADRELGAGFLVTEGIIDGADDIRAITHCTDPNREHAQNVLLIRLAAGCSIERLVRAERNQYMTSSCGICGKASLEQVVIAHPARAQTPTMTMAGVTALEHNIPSLQGGFARTGGLHAAAACTTKGDILWAYEDVGRHNAIDKVVGHALLNGHALPNGATNSEESWLWISGRASFEVVQKAHLGGFSCVIAVGAPTSLACALATEARIGLVGFCRNGRANVYSGTVTQ